MILQALSKYYDRLVETPDVDISQPGYASCLVDFVAEIDNDGQVVSIRDLREKVGKKLVRKTLLLPFIGRCGNVAKPQFMWDNTKYVFGATKIETNLKKVDKSIKDDKRAREQLFPAFRDLHLENLKEIDTPEAVAFKKFLHAWNPEQAVELENWDDIVDGNIVFRLTGQRQYLHELSEVKNIWQKMLKGSNTDVVEGFCLVAGEYTNIARLHEPKIKNVDGAQTVGAGIVAFNKEAFCSYGKNYSDQGFNAPVGEETTFKYCTALNYLLRRDANNRQRIRVGDATTVFWAEQKSLAEDYFGNIMNPIQNSELDKKLQVFLEGVTQGKIKGQALADTGISPDDEFYILGLSPNASRISIRFWYVNTVEELFEKVGLHFSDLEMVRSSDKDSRFPGIWRVLVETVRKNNTGKADAKDISPILAGEVMRSILTGRNYPQLLLTSIINRIRADQTVNYLRAALIKACIVRKARNSGKPLEVKMSLDTSNTDIAYLLGRLFAVLEKTQASAIPGANSTIRDRYFGSASSTPANVFPTLLRLGQHHIKKSSYGGIYDKKIEEIVSNISSFPKHMSLEQQGMFTIGYYHQRQDLYKKKEVKNDDVSELGSL